MLKGNSDQEDSTATGKRLKNRRKKQKKIEKKVLQQIISTQTVLVRDFDNQVNVKPSVDVVCP